MCDDDRTEPEPTRRELLGAAVGLVVVGCGKTTPKWEATDVPASDGIVELNIPDFPELVTPGNMIAIRPDGARETVLVMRLENDEFRVLSMKCPHLGCTVRWDNEEQRLRCPCHGSRFDDHGQVVKGPAKQALREYPSNAVGTKLRFSVKS